MSKYKIAALFSMLIMLVSCASQYGATDINQGTEVYQEYIGPTGSTKKLLITT